MRKFIGILFVALFLLVACSDQDSTSTYGKHPEDTIESQDQAENQPESAIEENGTETEEESKKERNEENNAPETNKDGQTDQKETNAAFDIRQNPETNAVELVDPTGKTIVLAKELASEPVKSPSRLHAVYLAPFEWEMLTDLYLVNLETGEQKPLVKADPENKPKNVIWLDHDHVLAIIGYPYGTVSTGGNIYKINIHNGEKVALTNYEGDIQITDFYIEDGVLHYSGIQYTDDIFNEHKEYENQIDLK